MVSPELGNGNYEINPKMQVIGAIFGRLLEWLEIGRISTLLPGLIVFGMLIYFLSYRKNQKLGGYDKFAMAAWIWLLLLTILNQILLFKGPIDTNLFLPERVRQRLESSK